MDQAITDVGPQTASRALPFVEDSGVGHGHVENPFYLAELRRWRNRPFLYLTIGAFTTFLIAVVAHGRNGRLGLGFGPGTVTWLAIFLDRLPSFLLRPSSIIPAIMVWRAMYSFREGPFYEPFRLTFLPPRRFALGVIAVPAMLSAVLVLAYTSFFLAPTVFGEAMRSNFGRHASLLYLKPLTNLACIIIEGGANGLLVAVITLYFGMRHRLDAWAVAQIIFAVVCIEALQSATDNLVFWWGNAMTPLNHGDIARVLCGVALPYIFWTAPKLLAAGFVWSATVRGLARLPAD